MSAGKTHRKMSILRRNWSLRSCQTETATPGSKDDPVAQLVPLPIRCANRAARQSGNAPPRLASMTRAPSAIYTVGKVTAVLLFWNGARPGSLRFYGHEVDEQDHRAIIH